ncbi:hypothetical protein AB0M39_40980 [Streptomyces sp. NPDC051907]|uniref:hypothetical protein n=1 Tax=Streptomyces sp. NPDC051907 TaxID=3155284 RepID=UPI00344938D6
MTFTLDQLRKGHHVTATDESITVIGTVFKVGEDPSLPSVDIMTASGDTHRVPVELITERTRPLHEIAADIRESWGNVTYSAVPYLVAMRELDKITDDYGHDSGEGIVRRFLGNARGWRGEKAKEIKAELRALAGMK